MLNKETIFEMVVGQIEKEVHRLERLPSLDWLRERVHEICSGMQLNEDDEKTIIEVLRTKVEVTVGEAAVLVDDKPRAKWLTEERRESIDWYFWSRFKNHFHSKDIPESVLRRTDKDTNLILSLLGDPVSQNGFSCRGMVIGDVQAGKTNNYSALINKAADAGYKLIIVLTGIMEDLRQQTQERLDSDFVGSVSIAGRFGANSETKIIGVGRTNDSRLPFCLTDRDSDVKQNPRYRIDTINEPILVVTKKNKSPLQRLLNWLTSEVNAKNGAVEQPVLVIDDEADNASVNTGSEDEDPRTINRLIREVVSACRRSSYVAYTATPFANIFIDPDSRGDRANTDDLFPRDFIVALEPPNNYCGAKYFFRTDDVSDRACIQIEDADEHLPIIHRPGVAVESIPPSLEEAIGVFLITCSIKDIRREKHLIRHKHDSMLINMSRLTSVQSDLAPHVARCLDEFWRAITVYVGVTEPERRSSEMRRLYDLWSKHFKYSGKEQWEEICSSWQKMEKPKIVTVHSRSGEALVYEDNGPKKQIAIGGLKLSRGLTLEGLVVSYFYRRSIMYDSLMQMGRWYGYRDGYQDLLRLWITSESQDWYVHISEASDDLREQVAEMQRRSKTPREFGLRVKASPDALMVTAANKMRNAISITTRLRFDDRLLETDCVDSRPEIIERNLEVFAEFIAKIESKRRPAITIPERHRQHIHFSNVEAERIISFLKEVTNHPSCGLWAESDLFLQFLQHGAEEELANWDVFVFQLKGDSAGTWQSKDGDTYGRMNRTIVKKRKNPLNNHEMRLNAKQTISDKVIEDLGLSEQDLAIIEEHHGRVTNREARRYRSENRRNPSLIFHVIKANDYADEDKKILCFETTVLGWAISIPSMYSPHPDVHWEANRDWFERYGTQITLEEEL